MVQLGFEKTKELPDEDTFWDWLVKEGLADQPGIDMDFIDREVIERKYYICMKEEEGTKWLVKQFEKGVFYNDNNNVDHLIKARQMGEIWKTITVRGVNTATQIETIEQHFKQFGEVKEISFGSKLIFCYSKNSFLF